MRYIRTSRFCCFLPNCITNMATHQSLIPSNHGRLFFNNILDLKPENECLRYRSLSVLVGGICPCSFLLGEQDCSCTFASDHELQLDTASQPMGCLISQGRCRSRAWTCSRGEVDLQAMIKVHQTQHVDERTNMELPDRIPYATVTSD